MRRILSRLDIVNLADLRVIDVPAERHIDGPDIRRVSVAGYLRAIENAQRQVVNQFLRVVAIALADNVREHGLVRGR